jgi:SAM-dependent methyltransferase
VSDRYIHGHHESVLRSHRWRTAENSAGYLLPHLRAGMDLLDVGCGPGTITVDLAARVAPGRVTGLDVAPEVVAEAAKLDGAEAVDFRTGDVYALDFPDATFDVVHAHQVLHHLADPVAALREMRRVVRPGGIVAVRELDNGGGVWEPADPLMDRWMEMFREVAERNGSEPNAGRKVLGWALAAGFTDLTPSSSTWTFATPEDRAWWGGLWKDRMQHSGFAQQALEYGVATREDLDAISAAFARWAQQPDGFFVVLSGELIARR